MHIEIELCIAESDFGARDVKDREVPGKQVSLSVLFKPLFLI